MKRKIFVQASVLSLGILFFSTSVLAGGYWGLGAGSASLDLKPLFGTEELEDSTMLKFILGSRTKNFALELDISAGVFDWVSSSANSHAVAVVSGNVLGFIPISETFELFGKAGLNTSSTSVDYYGSVYEGDSGFGISYGAGLLVNVTEKFALRAEYQGITGIDDGVDSGDLDWVSVQLVFAF